MRCFGRSTSQALELPICRCAADATCSTRFQSAAADGWSGAEDGATGSKGRRRAQVWVAPMRKSSHLAVNIFPICVPGRPQGVTIEANGRC